MKKETYTPGQLKKLMEIIEGTGTELMQAILGSGILSDVFDPNVTLDNRHAVRKALGLGPLPSEAIVLIVDYGKMLEQMIAAGHYDWATTDITANRFLIEGNGMVEFEAVLFHFDKDISSEDAKEQIEQASYEVGKIEHILSFGANYPKEQLKFPILGLGSVGVVDGRCGFPCINGSESRRRLSLGWCDIVWSARCRFLGVRKKVSKASAS